MFDLYLATLALQCNDSRTRSPIMIELRFNLSEVCTETVFRPNKRNIREDMGLDHHPYHSLSSLSIWIRPRCQYACRDNHQSYKSGARVAMMACLATRLVHDENFGASVITLFPLEFLHNSRRFSEL